MADVKISALPSSTTPLAGTEVLPIVQSSTTKKVTVADLTAGRTVNADTLNATNVEVTNVKANDGTAAITISDSSGNVGIGGTAIDNAKLHVLGTFPVASGNVNSNGFNSSASVPSSITGTARGFNSNAATDAASFTLTNFIGYHAAQSTFGAGSTVTNQYGFFAEGNLTGATNNYGFYSNIASGSGRYNFFANGSADNYFAGNVGIGTTNLGTAGLSLSQNFNLSWEQSSTESIVNMFRQTSSAATVVSNGYKRSATANGFASSYGSSWAKTALGLGVASGAITFYTDSAATASVGTDVTPTERMRIDSSGKITDQYGNIRAIPQSGSAKTGSYTLAVTDVGQFIEVGSGGSITVPDATFAAGDVVSIFNNTTGTVTLTMSITTAYIGGANVDEATIDLATRGVATILFISGTVCVVNGNVS
jgi:hypothetical protein